MAHHHRGHFEQLHGVQDCLAKQTLAPAATAASASDDDLATEPDEPPEQDLQLKRVCARRDSVTAHCRDFAKMKPPRMDRQKSLLTEGLAPKAEILALQDPNRPSTAPNLSPISSKASWTSAPSTAELTSDGGLTSPARTVSPSPPLPPGYSPAIHPLSKDNLPPFASRERHDDKQTTTSDHVPTAETGPVRRRCITFACDHKEPVNTQTDHAVDAEPKLQPKRPCVLRFACPSRPSEPVKHSTEQSEPDGVAASFTAQAAHSPSGARTGSTSHSVVRASSPTRVPSSRSSRNNLQPSANLGRTEATRFHEFASSVEEVDEWMTEPTQHKKKLTVDDTLGKEKTIRQLGEEAEEEARQDEEPDGDGGSDDGSDAQDEADEDECVSDDGNESDDEDGFADSDGETEPGSDSLFWIAGQSTAATSIDQLDQGRRRLYMTMSDLSLNSTHGAESSSSKSQESCTEGKLRTAIPKLPDSTDYVCGTLDEDRVFEEAYMSHMEQMKHSTRLVIPQDIDPSFPTSDLEDEDDEQEVALPKRKSPHARDRRMTNEDCDTGVAMRASRTPPVRRLSPVPLRRDRSYRSFALPALAGPCLDRRRVEQTAGVVGTISPRVNAEISSNIHPQRPPMKRTKSLPRTPNPYYHQCATGTQMTASSGSPSTNRSRRNTHKRCAVDIVCGLEVKRQRLREKARHKYCQRAARHQDRRLDAGQGAERMRELGLEMAGRGRNGHGPPRAQCVLSI